MFNLLYQVCKSNMCSSSCNGTAGNQIDSTDNNPYTGGGVVDNQGEGRSWASFLIPQGAPLAVFGIYIRGIWPVNTTLSAIGADGTSLLHVATLGPAVNYLDLSYPAPSEVPPPPCPLTTVLITGTVPALCRSIYRRSGDCASRRRAGTG
jgi:hypothetical protein